MDLRTLRDQGQITIVAAVVFRWRVAPHDALQQDATCHLQAPAFEEAFGSHDLATGDTVKVGSDTFDLVDAQEVLGERARGCGGHDACPCCYGLATT
ncbi:hypothetical protein D3C81_1150050 [compost metagenome]